MKMETNREVGTGGNRLRLALRLVCVGTRTIDCVRINKKDAQLRTQSITLASSRRVSFAGLLPNGSAHTFSGMVPILESIYKSFIIKCVRRGKDTQFSDNHKT